MPAPLITPAPRTARSTARAAPVRRILRALSTMLIVTGALLVLDAGVTVAWQEPVSAIYGKVRQANLSTALRGLDHAAPSSLDARALARLPDRRRRIAFLARSLERRVPEGDAVGRIRIPHISASFVVVKGTSTSDLHGGPGIYPQTRFPGVPGTTAIAGHRTTYLAPFRHIDALRPGDVIVLDMPYGRFTYTVEGHRIVGPSDLGVIDPVGYDRLVLSACTPLYSAAQRIVVFARLTSTQAPNPARSA